MTVELVQVNATQLKNLLPWAALVNAIETMFRGDCQMPLRHHHTIKTPDQEAATLLLMPAWIEGRYVGVKLVTVFPGNRRQNLPSIYGNYLLSCGQTGQALALLDGGELTARRTAAASVLAARYLARKDARHHLMVGTGRLSGNLVDAYRQVLGIESFAIWGKNQAHSEAVAKTLRAQGVAIQAVADLDQAVAEADIISCATASEQPLLHGQRLTPGTHVDLIGGFTPTMREADDEAIRRARVYVDTREGAITECGDIAIPLATGVISAADIQGDLYSLCRQQQAGRQSPDEITLFKSVGAACEDLAAAILAYEQYQNSHG